MHDAVQSLFTYGDTRSWVTLYIAEEEQQRKN